MFEVLVGSGGTSRGGVMESVMGEVIVLWDNALRKSVKVSVVSVKWSIVLSWSGEEWREVPNCGVWTSLRYCNSTLITFHMSWKKNRERRYIGLLKVVVLICSNKG